jgi:hypothetical protein
LIEKGVRALLVADSTVTALIGTRIYPNQIPVGVMPTKSGDPPCVSYQCVSGSSEITLHREIQDERRIQFDAWATTTDQCQAIQSAIRYVGTLPNGVRVIVARSESFITDFDEAVSRNYRIIVDYKFTFVEP